MPQVLYLVLLTVSILFDSIHFASLPAIDKMTPGDAFGAEMWCGIFFLKPLIAATIIAYEKLEGGSSAGAGHQYTNFDRQDPAYSS